MTIEAQSEISSTIMTLRFIASPEYLKCCMCIVIWAVTIECVDVAKHKLMQILRQPWIKQTFILWNKLTDLVKYRVTSQLKLRQIFTINFSYLKHKVLTGIPIWWNFPMICWIAWGNLLYHCKEIIFTLVHCYVTRLTPFTTFLLTFALNFRLLVASRGMDHLTLPIMGIHNYIWLQYYLWPSGNGLI